MGRPEQWLRKALAVREKLAADDPANPGRRGRS